MRLAQFLAGTLIIAGQALPMTASATTLSPHAKPQRDYLPIAVCIPSLDEPGSRPPCVPPPPFVDPRVVDPPPLLYPPIERPIFWNDCCHAPIYTPPHLRSLPIVNAPR